MSFDMSGWLDDDAWRITGVASEAHPAGGAYAIPCPSIRDTALLRRITSRFPQIADTEIAAKQAADAGDTVTAEKHSATLTDLLDGNTADLCAYLNVSDLGDLDRDPQEAMQRKLLGPVYDQMVDDGVTSTRLERVYQATVLRFTQNEEVVRLLVEFEGKAAALDNRATRRAAKKAAPRKAASSNSSPTATSKSTPASTATPARTRNRASTRSSKPSAAKATKTG
jgi:hypothetical protein